MATTDLKTAATGQVAKQDNINMLLGQDKNRKMMGALVGKYMNPERMLALCVNAIRKTPKLAQCDPRSVLGAMMASAGLGLEPNTPAGHAYLVPYDKRGKLPDGKWGVVSTECQFLIGYKGFVALAYRSPLVESVESEAIHENDTFEHMQGSKNFLTFKKALKNRGDIIGAYCLIKLKGGAELAVTLPIEEIHKARDKSETYQALRRKIDSATSDKDRAYAEKQLADTPWVLWEDDMASKTVIKKLVSKRLSIASNDPLAIAANIDERAIDLSALADPEVARKVFDESGDVPGLEDQQGEYVPTNVTQEERAPIEGQARREPKTQDANPNSGAPVFTYESVLSAIDSSATDDALAVAADQIQHVQDIGRREQLAAAYKRRQTELHPPQDKPASRRRPANSPDPM